MVVFKTLMIVSTGVLLSQPQGINELLCLYVLVTAVTALWRQSPTLQRVALLLPVADIVDIRLTVITDGTAVSGDALMLIFH